VRDEAHRFAVTFHRARRAKSRVGSELGEVPGIGRATADKLLRRFGSAAEVRRATEHELAQVAGGAAARRLKMFFSAPEAGPGEIS
jgi:excinuclease ABC subunit C